MIGRAQEAAEYAYERNVWAEHWFLKMRESEQPEEFWGFAILYAEVVDGRIDVWSLSEALLLLNAVEGWPRIAE